MSINHNGGNIIPEVTREEHDGELNAKRTSLVSAATIYAVVNTGAAGVGNSIVTIANTPLSTQILGNVTISDSKNYIGLTTTTVGNTPTVFVGTPTLFAVVNTAAVGITNSIVTVAGGSLYGNVTLDDGSLTGIVGNVTLSDSKGFIGLTTSVLGAGISGIGFATIAIGSGSVGLNAGTAGIGFATVNVAGGSLVGNVTLDDGSLTGIVGNVTLSDAKTFIGLATTVNGAGTKFIGLVTAWVSGIAGNITLSDSRGYIGLNTVTIGVGTQKIGLVTLSASNANIGSVSVLGGLINVVGNITLSDSKGFIGLNTVVNGAGTQFIGLVTAWARNAGTTKTLVQLPVGLGNNSLATVAVPTNNQKINITQLILNSNVTTEIAIKSGVTYLTGNATLGITLFPGGGFVMNGSPDSPVWISLPSGSMVVEKRDSGGTVSKVAGHAIYFDE